MTKKCIWLFLVVLVFSVSRETLTCSEPKEKQKLATELEKVKDWEKVGNIVNINVDIIKENCAASVTLAQCHRRELVKAHCDMFDDPHQAKKHLAGIIEKQKRQEQIHDREGFKTIILLGLMSVFMYYCTGKRRLIIAATALLILHSLLIPKTTGEQFSHPLATSTPNQSMSFPELSCYADYLRAVYSTSPIAISDKFPPIPSKQFMKLALVKKEKVSRAEADKFTRLTLRGDIDQILQVKEPIEMDDILKADDKVRLVVVEGAPGIGKSTLAWELCRQWATLESLKRFSLVVLHRLREPDVQSATDISDLFPCEDDPALSSFIAHEVKRQNGKGVLFLFDGFDEFPLHLRQSLDSNIVMKVIAGKLLPKATVLVTSRPSATADLQSVFQTSISKHIEIVGFSGTEIQNYAESIFRKDSKTPGPDLTSFNAYVSTNPLVKGMMYNPLNCAIVVGLYQDSYVTNKPIPHTQTQLYTELTLFLLSRYLSVTGDPLVHELPDNLEDIPHDNDLYKQLVKVGQLAFNGKLKDDVIFNQLPEGCSDLGLLVKHTALYTRKNTTTYSFFHVTLQEYMSAFYISQLQGRKQRALFNNHAISDSFNMVWKFVAGLTKMRSIGWNEFIKMKKGKHMVSNEYMVEDEVLRVGLSLIQYFYEAQDNESCESVFGHYRVAFSFDLLTLPDYFALGYCISACSNTWNITTSGTSGEALEILGHGMNSSFKLGSIDELDFFWSKGILNEGLKIPCKILRHIKSLKLSLCDIDQRGFENLAECIPYLHSLTSLDISKNPGGDGSLVKLLQALKKHKLQTLNMQHVAMGKNDVVVGLADLVQLSSSLRELVIGNRGHDHSSLSPDVEQQLVQTVLSPSSLETLWVRTDIIHPLEYLETISDGITTLSFVSVSHKQSIPKSSMVKGGTKLSHILRKNTSLKELKLHIPLDEDEVCDILESLNDNHSLEWLKLSHAYHFQYKQQPMDSRVIFE